MGLFQRAGRQGDLPELDPAFGDPAGRRLITDTERRDWRAVHTFLGAVGDPDDLDFYVRLCADVVGVQAWAGEWDAAEPHAQLPALIRGAHAIRWAWWARGGAYASETTSAQFRIFHRRLLLAQAYLTEATTRNADDPTAWAQLITCGMGLSLDLEHAWHAFREATARQRWHIGAHQAMLTVLCAKWQGSHEEMFRFARETASTAPPETGLASLVADAHVELWLALERDADDSQGYLRRPEVVADLHAAAGASIRHPAYRRRPGWQGDLNRFATAFWLAEQYDPAAEIFDVLSDLCGHRHWQYVSGNPAAAYAKARAECYAKRTAGVPR